MRTRLARATHWREVAPGAAAVARRVGQWRGRVARRSACFAVSADGPDELFRVVKKREERKNTKAAVEFGPWQYVVSVVICRRPPSSSGSRRRGRFLRSNGASVSAVVVGQSRPGRPQVPATRV